MNDKFRLLLQTMKQVLVGAVTDGKLLANTELLRNRLKICSGCPELESNLCCSKCGCRVAYKARLKHASCPIRKW